jgi:Nucleotidyl transferase AbiEii toxin, Type IV TA system
MTMVARVTAAPVRLQIDVRFGDVVTPPPVRMDLPVLLDFPTPHLLVYPRETVVAEKLDAIVQFGTANGRTKDFYDLFVLARGFNFDGRCWSVRSARRSNGERRRCRSSCPPASRTNSLRTRKTDTVDGVRPEVGRARRARSSDHHHGDRGVRRRPPRHSGARVVV